MKEYSLSSGHRVSAGQTAAENDRLSMKVAKPDDYWFHVRGMTGSHVVLHLDDAGEPSKEVLKEAAAIAAYHSKAREGGVVPVSCTRSRYVSKYRGAKPGKVTIRKEVVLKVRPAVPGN